MRVLITGITGFIGSYLAKLCLKKNCEVYGNVWVEEKTLRIDSIKKYIHLIKCDIRNEKQVLNMVKLSKPDIIFHLAAQSFPTVSWEVPFKTMVTNAGGTINLLESVKKLGINPKIVIACSSDEYGKTFIDKSKKKEKIKETDAIFPLNPYAVSKVTQELLSKQYFENFGLRTVAIRIFNTTGPGKTGDASAHFAEQIVKIEKNILKNPILIGNLDTERDVSDVRDMSAGLWAAATKAKDGEVYNICSGKTIKTKRILKTLISLSNRKISYKLDPSKIRPADVPFQCGNNNKFKKYTGWTPKYDLLENTLPEIIAWWRNHLN